MILRLILRLSALTLGLALVVLATFFLFSLEARWMTLPSDAAVAASVAAMIATTAAFAAAVASLVQVLVLVPAPGPKPRAGRAS